LLGEQSGFSHTSDRRNLSSLGALEIGLPVHQVVVDRVEHARERIFVLGKHERELTEDFPLAGGHLLVASNELLNVRDDLVLKAD